MPDILSEADAGTGNRKVDGSRLPLDDLIGRFALRPRVSLNVTVDGGGGGGKRKKRGKEDFIWLASQKRGGKKRGSGREEKYLRFRFVFILHTWREITKREREGKV